MRSAILLTCLVLAGIGVGAAEPGKDDRHPFKRDDVEATFAWLCLRADRMAGLEDAAHDDELESITAEVVGRRFHWTLRVEEAHVQRVIESKVMRVRFLPLVKKAKGKGEKQTCLWIEPDFGRKGEPKPPFQVTHENWQEEDLRYGNKVRLHGRVVAVRLEGDPKVGWSYHFEVDSARLWRDGEPWWTPEHRD